MIGIFLAPGVHSPVDYRIVNTLKKCSACGALYSGDNCTACVSRNRSAPAAPFEELPLQPGQTFHGLEVLELLGRGGMGVVYKAQQPALDRWVALKILPQRLALDPDFQGRFVREARALGALSHPNRKNKIPVSPSFEALSVRGDGDGGAEEKLARPGATEWPLSTAQGCSE